MSAAAPTVQRAPRRDFFALFLISAAAVGLEIALARYFAVAKWSEYGYWVISIVMVGFALSGVAMAMFRDLFVRHADALRTYLPALMVAAAAAGFHFTIVNPFNPLELQNHATWADQLWNIFYYYLSLFPFYFLAGIYISLTFVLNARETGTVYGFDLAGAGLGAAGALGLMFLVHPFSLVPVLLVPLAASVLLVTGRRRHAGLATALAALAAGEALLLLGPQATINDFKAIYAPLHTPGARVVAEHLSPRGDYVLLKDFTERLDTDLSNNASLLGVSGPPATLGLYRDGNRIAALPFRGGLDSSYASSTLAAAPYMLLKAPRVLLVGGSGGFRVAEALRLGASRIDVVEGEPMLRHALKHGLAESPALPADPRLRILGGGPIGTARAVGPDGYDLVDISGDYLETGEANATAFSAEAIADYLRILPPEGIVSLPVSIRDLPVYALRTLATAREALRATGADAPAAHILVYRSAWNARILVSPAPWTPERIARLRAFADDRSFDVSYYPGIDLAELREGLYNDLPAVSFDTGETVSQETDDAIAAEAAAVIAGQPSRSSAAFNLDPITLDRPLNHAALKLSHFGLLLKRLEVLPQGEIGGLVNVAVLAQAAVIGLIVLAVPLIAPGRLRAGRKGGGGLLWVAVYFASIGLAFLFIEIFLIEKASFYLSDRTAGFAIVLTAMLVFSGAGSFLADRFAGAPQAAVLAAVAFILLWLLLVFAMFEPFLLATLAWPAWLRIVALIAVTAPVSVALGLPFPLGLKQVGSTAELAWAWGLNGAFSVVATPLANLVARSGGLSQLLLCAALLYLLVCVALPAGARLRQSKLEMAT